MIGRRPDSLPYRFEDPRRPASAVPLRIRERDPHARQLALNPQLPSRDALRPIMGRFQRMPDGTVGGVPVPKPSTWGDTLSKTRWPRNANPETIALSLAELRREKRRVQTARMPREMLAPGPGPLDFAARYRFKPGTPSGYRGDLNEVPRRADTRGDVLYAWQVTPSPTWQRAIRERMSTGDARTAAGGVSQATRLVTPARAQEIIRTETVDRPRAESETAGDRSGKVLALVAAAVIAFVAIRG